MVSISPLVHYLPHTLDGILSKLSCHIQKTAGPGSIKHQMSSLLIPVSLFHCIFLHEVRPV